MNDESDGDIPDDGSVFDDFSDEENDGNVINIDPQVIAVAHRLIKSQPLKKAARKVKTKCWTDGELRDFNAEVEEYLTTLFNFPYCFARYHGRFVSCRCLQLQRQDVLVSTLAIRLGK
jgi:hypothetical protein